MTAVSNKAGNADLYAQLNASNSSVSAASGGKSGVSTAQEQNDRFLKLLTTQLTNQDPLNPMDNAQMTSQMAQISTVSGLEKLNESMSSLSSQFVQMQAMQGAALVGRSVTASGDALTVADGRAQGAFQLDAAADKSRVEVLNAAGQLVKTVDLGGRDKGRHDFSVDAKDLNANEAYSFRIVASSGNTALEATEMVRDTVAAVNTSGKTLTLELTHGAKVEYAAVQAIN